MTLDEYIASIAPVFKKLLEIEANERSVYPSDLKVIIDGDGDAYLFEFSPNEGAGEDKLVRRLA